MLSSLSVKTLPWSIIDIADTFSLEPFDPATLAEARISAPQAVPESFEGEKSPPAPENKVLVVEGDMADVKESMPMFDVERFYKGLEGARKDQGLLENTDGSERWGMGEAMFYGEAVTSTQTMLDK